MAIAMSYHSWLVRWHLWSMDWQARPWYLVVARYLMIMPWILLPFGQLLRADAFGRAWYMAGGLVLGGIGQYLFMPDMRWLRWFGWDDHYYRMIGLLYDPNYLALLFLLIGIYVWFTQSGWQRRLLGLVVMVCLLATYSRTAWLIGIILCGVLSVKKRAVHLLLLGLAICGGIWLALPKPGGEGVNIFRSFSISSRIESWKTAGSIWLQSPLFGIGYNRYGDYLPATDRFGAPYHPASPDSSWILVLSTMGIVGLGVFSWMWWQWLSRSRDMMVTASLLTIGLHAWTNNSFFYPWVLLWIWLLLLRSQQSEN